MHAVFLIYSAQATGIPAHHPRSTSASLQPGGPIVPSQAASPNAPSELRDLVALLPTLLLASASSSSSADSAAALTSLQQLLQAAGLGAAAQRVGLTRVMAAGGAGGSSSIQVGVLVVACTQHSPQLHALETQAPYFTGTTS